jgi:hypothetical protein
MKKCNAKTQSENAMETARVNAALKTDLFLLRENVSNFFPFYAN